MSETNQKTECDTIQESLAALLHDELSTTESQHVRGHLQQCDRCAEELAATDTLLAVLQQEDIPDQPESGWPAIAAQIAAAPERVATEPTPDVDTDEATPRGRRIALWLSSAAAAAAVLLILFAGLGAPQPLGTALVAGTVKMILPNGSEQLLQPGASVPAGAVLTTGADGRVTLQIPGEPGGPTTDLTLGSDGELTVHTAAAMALTAGRLEAQVAPQDTGFTVTTPHGRVEVTGTQFTVEITNATTVLTVREGEVRFHAPDDSATLVLHEDQVAVADAAGHLLRIPVIGPVEPTPTEGLYLRVDAAGGRTEFEPGAPVVLTVALAHSTGTVRIPKLSHDRATMFYMNIGREGEAVTSILLDPANLLSESGEPAGEWSVTVSPKAEYRFAVDLTALAKDKIAVPGRYGVSVSYYNYTFVPLVPLKSEEYTITIVSKEE